MPFPEAFAPQRMIDDDHARPFLHTSKARWSYGAMKVGLAGWAQLVGVPVASLMPHLVDAGVDGVHVDRFGYSDDAAAVEEQLRSPIQMSPRVSPGGRAAFLDLRPCAARLRRSHVRADLDRPAAVTAQPGGAPVRHRYRLEPGTAHVVLRVANCAGR